jgi:hypothetical protein
VATVRYISKKNVPSRIQRFPAGPIILKNLMDKPGVYPRMETNDSNSFAVEGYWVKVAAAGIEQLTKGL